MQLLIDWDKRDRDLASLKTHGARSGLLSADIDLLVSVATADVLRSETSYACKSKRQWALGMGGCSPNTVVAAMRRLAVRKIAAWEATPEGHAILVDWQAFWALPPDEPASRRDELQAALAAEKPALVRGVVRGGQARLRVLVDTSKARVDVQRDNVSSATRAGVEVRLDRPWSRDRGLTGEDLRWAVQTQSRVVLHRLYFAAVEAGWWGDCEDHRVKFMILVHHCATCGESPMALLTSLCRKDDEGTVLRSSRCQDASRDWETETRQKWRRDRVLVGAEAERLKQPRRVLEVECE